MSSVFPTFMRNQLVSNANLYNPATLGMAMFYRAPRFFTGDVRYLGIQTLADLRVQVGWGEVEGVGYPLTTTHAVNTFSHVDDRGRTQDYVRMTEFPLNATLLPVQVRALAFYYVGTVGGVTNPVVLITNTPFNPVMTLQGGDSISPQHDATLSVGNDQWLFGWGATDPANTMVEGPLSIQKGPPDYEAPHTQHAWMFPQRVNFIANPSFERDTQFWRTNGTPSVISTMDALGVKAGQFTGHTPIVAESNTFPVLKPRFTVQLMVSGHGQVRVGLITWPVDYNETVIDWGNDDEVWDISEGSFIHLQVLRSAPQPYEAQLRVEASGDLLILNNVLVENDYLLDWPYFDGDTRYGSRDDFSWYGGENLKGKTFSLWYNNKRATAGRLFATSLEDQAKLTSADVLSEGLVYQWIPAGLLVEPHWDVLFVGDLQHPVTPVSPPVTPYKAALYGTPEWGADMGVTSPWPDMSINMLTPAQASFETTDTSGWEIVPDATAPVNTVPMNMLSTEQATMEGNFTSAGTTRACGWITGVNNTLAQVTGDSAAGTSSLLLTATVAQWLSVNPASSAGVIRFPAVAGDTYTIMASLRSDTPSMQVGFQMYWYDSAGAVISNPVTYTPVTASWVQYRQTFVAPAGAVTMVPYLTRNVAAGVSYRFDRAGLYHGDISTWYAPSEGWAQNLLTYEQSNFEVNVNTSSGRACNWKVWSGNQTTVWNSDPAFVLEGAHSLQAGRLAAGNWAQVTPCPANGANSALIPSAVAGQPYTFLSSVICAQQDDYAQVSINWRAAGGTANGAINWTSSSSAGVWRQSYVAGIAPASTVDFTMIFGNNFTTANPGVDTQAYLDKAAVYSGWVMEWFDPRWVSLDNAVDSGALDGARVMLLSRLAPTGPAEARTTTVNNAVAGKFYSAIAYFKASKVVTATVYLDWLDSGGTLISSTSQDVTTSVGNWVPNIFTSEAPLGTGRVRLGVRVPLDKGDWVQVERAGLMDGGTDTWAPGGQMVPLG